MYVKALALYNFRNYKELLYIPSSGLNLIYGENGQGKTNLIESVFTCAFGRSQRTVHDGELIMYGEDSAAVKVKVVHDDGTENSISISLFEQAPKNIEIDGVKVKKLGDLMGILKVVTFSPESLSLVKGSPQERRRFLDMGISQLSRSYFFKLQQYNAALKQRNALLKTPEAAKCRDYIRMWDEQLALAGSYIVNARARFINNLKSTVSDMHERLSLGKDTLEMEYAPSVFADDTSAIYDAIMQKLHTCFDDDVRRGMTYIGPHKDDITLKTNGLDSKTYASQGQQRTAALALRLSETELIRNVCKENPVVLLDDVFSELDEGRCNALLESVSDCQCILTCAQDFVAESIAADIQTVLCQNGKIIS